MIDLHSPLFARAAVVALGIGLAGCAGLGDSFVSGAFVDPAKYDLYDCKQLENERKAQAARTADLQGLIDKAQTGAAGTVVGEAVYRNDYISARASAKLAEEAWQRGKCTETAPAIVAPVAAAAPKPARPR
ncbi:twin-arginine translocation pathway signal [Tardiphaga sp.]|uniref:twin-arginine translocation pathway signal n=1 Tax=Tardiphaga sp. TaxID=1926292 RepID=UPI002622AA67|nr:twin-arginine translocation pathway signal [Tardiphaga sp.]MDB5616051.1 Twin-arginine translocation pathway signal [Tardiphaga sp.]